MVLVVAESRAQSHMELGRLFSDTWRVQYARVVAELARSVVPWLELVLLRHTNAAAVVNAIDQLRKVAPTVRIVVATPRCGAEVVNSSQLAGAECIVLQNAKRNLRVLSASDLAGAKRRASVIARLANSCSLTPKQVETLALVLRERTQSEMATLLGISASSVKSRVRMLLRQCGARTTRDLLALRT